MSGARKWLLSAALAAGLWGGAARAEEALGDVLELAFGNLRLKEAGGAELALAVTQRETRYQPDTWRPAAGDRVSVAYTRSEGRRGPVLTATLVKLLKAGANSLADLKSPAEVAVLGFGRSGLKAEISGRRKVTFLPHAGTVYLPAGWQPAAGQQAHVEFRIQPAKVGFGLVYLADKVEKLD